MFRKMMRQLQALSVNSVSFDPSTLDDDVAMQTEWGPLKRGGASFQTHRLIRGTLNQMEFRMTGGAIAFFMLFVIIGLMMMSIGLQVAAIPSRVRVTLILLGVFFAGAAGMFFYLLSQPNVFDEIRGVYCKGRHLRHYADFDQIHALQLISEYIPSDADTRSYYSYELNLVLEDGQRINVVDHGNLAVLRDDAQTISQRIGKPVWDATVQSPPQNVDGDSSTR